MITTINTRFLAMLLTLLILKNKFFGYRDIFCIVVATLSPLLSIYNWLGCRSICSSKRILACIHFVHEIWSTQNSLTKKYSILLHWENDVLVVVIESWVYALSNMEDGHLGRSCLIMSLAIQSGAEEALKETLGP